jgi:hypothetical protein
LIALLWPSSKSNINQIFNKIYLASSTIENFAGSFFTPSQKQLVNEFLGIQTQACKLHLSVHIIAGSHATQYTSDDAGATVSDANGSCCCSGSSHGANQGTGGSKSGKNLQTIQQLLALI